MLVYRIVHQNYKNSLQGSGLAGRWNLAGQEVLYCADSPALAFLENMIRRQGVGFNKDFVLVIWEIPTTIQVKKISPDKLKKNWQDPHEYEICQVVGSDWYLSQLSVVLEVPSAVLPHSKNFVINAQHPDFKKIKRIAITPLMPDPRLEAILKGEKKH